ncbi:hypothetical protein DM860_010428 [Cuscuta australis]|uniref:Condensation domain-containing protein n=1 Tax=Cuscuta australis TaxID=267555 RepID=A0A328E2I3_9ASTE|nr:hypothetical protein DM860_010428 [Cuscuta australis]
MSFSKNLPEKHVDDEKKERVVGGTEHSWCRAVCAGTGITVLAFHASSAVACVLQNALPKIINAHPILRSKLHYNPSTKTFSFTTTAASAAANIVRIKPFCPPSDSSDVSLSPFQQILERELSDNADWADPASFPPSGADVVSATAYALPEGKQAVVLRFHTAVCDRTTAVSLLRELMEVVVEGTLKGIKNEGEGSFGIEDVVPVEKSKKKLWAHGLDMLGYSVNSFLLTNLRFKDVKGPRSSRVVRLQMNQNDTSKILDGCKSVGIKLCGVLTAAGLLAAAAMSSKSQPDHQKKKYGVVTLTDCRSLLNYPLSAHHFGFYHSAVQNVHIVSGGERLWDLAKASYAAFSASKKSNKHFSDMADLNFLMCKAIDNPSLTASSAMRSSVLTVFEDPVVYDIRRDIVGLEDFVGCSSVHGVGPSMAVFDAVIDGELDCACVYPSPLHSREQMQELVDRMKRLLVYSTYPSS